MLTPVTNFALRDREAGTVAVNSSVGMWKKLERIRQNPNVAVAFHTREHAATDRPEYVLVQGRASLSSLEDRDGWLEAMGDNWERFGGQPRDVGPSVGLVAERVSLAGEHRDRGRARGRLAGPGLRREPRGARGAAARPSHRNRNAHPPEGPVRASTTRGRRGGLRSLPHVLLGWVGADGLPMVVPVDVAGAEERGIVAGGARGTDSPGRPAGRPARALVQSPRRRPAPAQAHGLARCRQRRSRRLCAPHRGRIQAPSRGDSPTTRAPAS